MSAPIIKLIFFIIGMAAGIVLTVILASKREDRLKMEAKEWQKHSKKLNDAVRKKQNRIDELERELRKEKRRKK